MDRHLIAFADASEPDLITPALDARFKVRNVTLLADAGNVSRANYIASVCRDANLNTSVMPIPHGWHPEPIRVRLKEIIARGELPYLFNLSGANPIHSAIAHEVALGHQVPAFVVNPSSDQIHWLAHAPGDLPSDDGNVQDRLTLESFFAVYGIEIVSCSRRLHRPKPQMDAAADVLAHLAVQHPELINKLNGVCSLLTAEHETRNPIPNHPALLSALRATGLCRILPDLRLNLAQFDSRQFLGGGWFEWWLLHQVESLTPGMPIQDAAASVRVRLPNDVSNEFDVAILSNNHLYLIEAKTINAGMTDKGIGLPTLFKLDSVSTLGGLHADAMIASLSLPTLREANRAMAQDIEIVAGHALTLVQSHLRDWLRD
ncbi:Card1-like endonuclease domain-containing protein [Silvimonas soli]|uniref:Card1-like endonuclease domain-containing protein n=1 Tax=Silvimonas soli TaxID=2980100 RepID=UPI0024B32435|nr:DUF1887 family CARF protein [Silvimonas soli]